MSQYEENSAQALWNLIAIMGIADGSFGYRDELQEAKWSSDYVEDLFGQKLSDAVRLDVITETIHTFNELDSPEQRESFLHDAADNITQPRQKKLALAVLYNVLLADGRKAREENWVLNSLIKFWKIEKEDVEAVKSVIPTLDDIPMV